jgi:hypothetical protein
MRKLAAIFGTLVLGVTSAICQPSDLSQSDAAQMVLARFGICSAIPVGIHRIGYDNPEYARYLRLFEQRGIVVTAPVKRESGSAFQDLRNMQQDPLGSQIAVALAPGIDKNDLCTASDGKPGIGHNQNYGNCPFSKDSAYRPRWLG